ncbi:MAG: hypothetical protein ACLRTA_01915 [Clostridia bacterium]
METFKINMNEELNGVELDILTETGYQDPDHIEGCRLPLASGQKYGMRKDQKRHYKSLPN